MLGSSQGGLPKATHWACSGKLVERAQDGTVRPVLPGLPARNELDGKRVTSSARHDSWGTAAFDSSLPSPSSLFLIFLKVIQSCLRVFYKTIYNPFITIHKSSQSKATNTLRGLPLVFAKAEGSLLTQQEGSS